MDKFNIYRNWRIYVLMAVFAAAALLIVSDYESTEGTVIAKCAGIGLAWLFRSLIVYWQGRGKIDELMELAREED